MGDSTANDPENTGGSKHTANGLCAALKYIGHACAPVVGTLG